MSVDAQGNPVAGRSPGLSLFHRMSLLVAVPLLLLAMAALINAKQEYDQAQNGALEQAAALAQQAAARLDEHYEYLDLFLAAVGEVARATLLHAQDGDPGLTRLIHAMPQHVTGISILALDGRMIASTTAAPEQRAKINVADRTYFKEALASGRLVVGEPVHSRTTDLWVSIAGRPVYDDNGRAAGVVSSSARLDRIQTMLVPTGLPHGTLMTVFNQQGIGIASTAEPVAVIGRDIAKSATVRRALSEKRFSAKTEASDGQVRLVAYAAGSKLPWIVEVGLPIDLVLAPAKDQLYRRLILISGALFLALAAAAWLAHRIGHPIRELARAADELGKGDLARRAPLTGYREAIRLSTAFNSMADSIGAKQRELRDSEERLRATLQYSPNVAVQWYDRDGRVRFWNTASTAVFGWTPEEAMGRTLDDIGLYTPAQAREFIAALRSVDREGPRANPAETRIRRKDGTPGVIISTMFPLSGQQLYACMDIDITERKALEEQRQAALTALRESEAKFRALTALSSDWYWEQDAAFRFTSVGMDDPNWALPMLGKTRWELDGEPLKGTWADHQALLERHETFRNVVFRYTGAHGVTAYLSVNGEPMYDEAGAFRGYRGTATSVTERYRLEKELQERMELLRVTLDTAPVAIGVVRTRDNIALLANRAAYELLRVDPSKKDWSVLDYWGRREDARELKRRLERDGFVRDLEVPIQVAGRDNVWGLISAQPARYRGEDVTVATLNDITARKVLEAQSTALERQREALLANLRGANERLRLLSQQVLDAQESERRKIAHELHDEIGQNLTALKLLAGHLRPQMTTALQPQIDEWIGLLNQAIEQVRDLSRILRPAQLDLMGLVPALRALLDAQARAAGWSVEFSGDAGLGRIDSRVATVAYRVVQEALTNAARHADAAHVTLALAVSHDQDGDKLTLRVTDDGRGYDMQAARQRVQEGRSMGLLGMEERVRLVGGTFDVESAPTDGTRITVTLPFAVQAKEMPA